MNTGISLSFLLFYSRHCLLLLIVDSLFCVVYCQLFNLYSLESIVYNLLFNLCCLLSVVVYCVCQLLFIVYCLLFVVVYCLLLVVVVYCTVSCCGLTAS